MKNPKFGKTKLNSFIEFDTEIGRLRFGSEGKLIFLQIDEEKKYLTDVNGNFSSNVKTDSIEESTADQGVEIEGIKIKDGGILLSDNVVEYVEEVLISTDEIVGTAVGDLGHASGVPLVAAPGAGYVHEFVSAVLIYDFDTAAYTGGAGDDLVIRIGTTEVSPAVATADLITAAADQIVHLRALAAADYDLPANAAINLKSTAVTNPGTAAGVIRAHVTYRVHTTNL